MNARVVAVAALSAVVACSLTTDLDQFRIDGSSAGPGGEGGSPTTDGGADAAPAPVCAPSVDLVRDAKNCGRCGHDCLGGECRRGRCQPVVIAENIDNPNGIVSTSAGLYVGSDSGLLFIGLDGRKKYITEGGNTAPQFVASTATDVFWADYDRGAIQRVTIGSEDVVTIKNSVESVIGVALSPTFIFFTRPRQSLIQRMPFSLTQTEIGVEDVTTAYEGDGVDWAGGKLYIANEKANEVVEVPNDGSTFSTRRVVHEGCGPYGLKVDGPDVYVTCGKDDTFLKVRIDGSAPTEVLAEDLDGANGVAITPEAFYITEAFGGTVLKLAR